jgi:hypothetical protein
MGKKPHPFERFSQAADYRDRLETMASVAFEEAKVRYVFSVCKMSGKKAEQQLRQREDSERGRPDLTFRAFNDTYQSFPLFLGASNLSGISLHTDPRATLPAMYKDFSNTPFMQAYELFYEIHEDMAAHKKLGLVFPRKGLRHGLILYTSQGFDDIPISDRETLVIYAGGTKKKRQLVVVRSFQRTLEAIHAKGHGWKPDEK